MTDYTFPSAIIPNSISLTWMDNTVVFKSPLSGTTRTESRPGGRWVVSMTVQPLKNSTGSADPLHVLEAFLFKLNGAEHRAVIRDFGYARSGPAGGTPVVSGVGQTGKSLITSGWPNSTTVLYAGDRIGVSDQMIPLISDATSNGSGVATLTLAHPIRTAPSDASAIEVDEPTARYILKNNASFAAVPGQFKTTLIEFEESIP